MAETNFKCVKVPTTYPKKKPRLIPWNNSKSTTKSKETDREAKETTSVYTINSKYNDIPKTKLTSKQ